MAARVAYLTLVATGRLQGEGNSGAMPSQILCLTFTNKAAEELSQRVLRAVEGLGLPEGEEPTILTYHAFAARLLDDYGLRMGLEPGPRLLTEAQKWQLMASLLDEVEFEHFEVRSSYIIGEALRLADQMANHLAHPEAVAEESRRLAAEITGTSRDDVWDRQTLLKRSELATLIGLYARRKREIGAIDYGDQIALACELAERQAEVLREEGIPVEVVDLGGLLLLPEIVDVMSWLRLLEDPARNIALTRILMGPRWRIGYRDLVAMARWSAAHNRRLQDIMPSEDDMPGDVAFALAEALDHLHEIEGLSKEAVARLQDFRTVLGELREATAGSLGDLVGAVVERTGLLRELEASSSPSAAASRRNLLNLLQHVSSFAPVDGEATLSTLIAYLDTAEETEDELEPAQPSEANTVKLLTIHKAKGLEWPVVFVPGMAEHTKWPQSSVFPDASRQPNPLRQSATLPFELRGEADVLPRYQGDIKAFRAELRERGVEEERRLCYVALTRARDLLVCSSAYWYEGPQDPFKPGRFLEEVRDSNVAEIVAVDDPPAESPLVEERRRRAAEWPRPARPDDADELFPEGWHVAAREAVEDTSTIEWRVMRVLESGEVPAYRDLVAGHTERAELIRARTAPQSGPVTPTTLSVTGVIDYAKCPKLFYWSQVRPLPRRPNQRARLGSEVHRWIELQSRGQATLLDVDDLPDLSTEERLGEPEPAEGLREVWRRSRFAERVPLFTERPFLLYLDGMVVGGRIDAIFGEADGPWEVVDYKTGRMPAEDDRLTGLQLDLYALACA